MCALRAKIVLPVSKSNSGHRIAARLQRALLPVCAVVACCLQREKFLEMIHAHGRIHYFIFIYYLVRSRTRCSTADGSFIWRLGALMATEKYRKIRSATSAYERKAEQGKTRVKKTATTTLCLQCIRFVVYFVVR